MRGERIIAEVSEFQVFHRTPQRRMAYAGLAFLGLVFLVVGITAGPSLWRAGIIVGAILIAAGAGVATEPAFELTPEGLIIKRGGYLATDKVVRWSSIRSLEPLSNTEMRLELVDDSSAELRLGALVPEDRGALVSEIHRRMPQNRQPKRRPLHEA